MVDILYPVIALVALAVLLVLYFYAANHIKETEIKEQLKRLFRFCAIFSLIDTVWGTVAVGNITRNIYMFYIISVIFFIASAMIIYEWFIEFLIYSKSQMTRERKIIYVIPLFIECLFALTNIFTNWVFTIDKENWIYTAGTGQRVIYVIHILYMIALIHVVARRIAFANDKFTRNRFAAVLFCVVILTMACLMQDFFPNAPVMSIGCMFTGVVALIRISGVDEKKMLEDSNIHYQNSAREIYSAFEAMAKVYVSIHLLDLRTDSYRAIKSTPEVDRFVVPGGPASEQIKNVMSNIVEEEFRESMIEFVNLKTLSERLKDKSIIFQEFIGGNQGWCMAVFIKVEEDAAGNVIRVIHSVQNINDIKNKEIEYERAIKAALENQNTIYEEMLRAQTNGVIAINAADEIIKLNDAAAKLLGYIDAKHTPKAAKIVFANVVFENEEEFEKNLAIFKERGKTFEYSFSIKRGSDKKYIMASAQKFELNSGEVITILSLSDITKSKHVEAELKILSETDSLTRIDNRRSGEQKIISMMEREDIPGMLCIIDVNKFKGINDTYGHHIGDIVLQKVAECIRQSFRDTDVIMRLGGDEFAVYAKELINQGVCGKCMDSLFERIDAIDIEECKGCKPTISVGIAFYEGNKACTYNRLYQQADSVMYLSKGKGGNSYAVFKKLRG